MLTLSANISTGAARIQPIEPGTYPAVCYGLIDLGDQLNATYQKWQPKVLVMFELPGETIDLGDGPVSRVISQKYTASLNERSALRRDLAAWRSRDFTDEELECFDLRTIVGAPCLLNIVHREYNGSTYANISGIMKMPKGMPVSKPTLEKIVFDIDNDPLTMLDDMPEWVAKQIKESPQYKTRTAPVTDVNNLDIPDESDEYEDDDVPF